MVLSDRDIRTSMQAEGGIRITPLFPGAIQTSTVDLHLGMDFLRFGEPEVVDPRHGLRNPMVPIVTDQMDGSVTLMPRQLILGVTVERVYVPTNMRGRLEGKSSLGRLGLLPHVAAGYIDAGNELNITLELFNASQNIIVLVPGMQICQIEFQLMTSAAEVPYGPARGSRYFGSRGVEASKIEQNVFGREAGA